MKNKKALRRLTHLCGRHHPGYSYEHTGFSVNEKLKSIQETFSGSVIIHGGHKERLELLELFVQLKFSDQQALDFWIMCHTNHEQLRQVYTQKPIRERKDNKDFYNGTGGSNRNKVRFPRKVRKTAWKRFYKLFPELKK